MTHTKGPWQRGDVSQSWTELWGPDDAEGSHEILGSTIGPDQKANASLICAAPDLLAALKDLCCGHCHDMVGLPPGLDLMLDHRPCGFCKDARAAIAKATNEEA